MRSPTGPLARTLRRGRRRLAALAGRRRLELVYSRRYPIDLPGTTYDPLRGERILFFLDRAGLLGRRSLHQPNPASFRLLRRVHTDEYLSSLTQPGALTSIVGLELPERLAERVFEGQRTMAGGTLLATRLALRSGLAANLGGGLHHAFTDRGERLCVFNDVAVAIADLRAGGFAGPILIVDLDLHDGDGNRAIFARDPTVHTFSIHNQTNRYAALDAAAATLLELGDAVEDEAYLAALREHLPPVFESFRPELVIYLAGCDPAADDALGNWKISARGLLERDRFVYSLVRGGARKVPLAIVLAGGYGQRAWRYSARFLSFLVRGRPLEPPSTEEATLQRFRQIATTYGERELTGEPEGDDWGLTAEDLGLGAGVLQRPHRLLGYYSLQGIELAFERTGFFDQLRARGYEHPALEMDLENPSGDTLRIFGSSSKKDLLVELRLRIDRREVPDMALLRIEWLLLQDPRAQFSYDRPRLPGQRFPGLGLLQEIIALLVLVCDRLQLDGLLFVPAWFHTASRGRKFMRLLDPVEEARMRVLESAFQEIPLARASQAVADGRVLDAKTGQVFQWQPAPMV
ncbi:MAG TPA: histone deacetylase, partial [Thermoanaerobaculia bacterium]|nr:histone deacetylase [Thermoanaerobaculia bacterium]